MLEIAYEINNTENQAVNSQILGENDSIPPKTQPSNTQVK
jgi:hypothetical protein